MMGYSTAKLDADTLADCLLMSAEMRCIHFSGPINAVLVVIVTLGCIIKVKVKEGHTLKEHRWAANLHFIGR